MARRKPRPEEAERAITRKEHRLRARDRERNRKIMTWVGSALGLALLLVIAGLISEFVVRPNSAVATVGETKVVTRDFWKRTFLEQNRLQNQLIRLSQLEAQFGGQGFFTTQINQIQGVLSSPFTLGVEVLDQMVREEVVRQKAAEFGITVTEAEIDEALREEVAGQQGAVTVPQATSTAEALADATATAESWTPTPTATVDASGSITATATPIPTPLPPPTSTILTEEQYTVGLQELENNLNEIANMSLAEYREVVEARLLDQKLADMIGDEQVVATEEQVHARHILIQASAPVSPTAEVSPSSEITTGDEITSTDVVTTADVVADEDAADEDVDASEAVTSTEAVSEPEAVTDTDTVTETDPVSDTTGSDTEVSSSDEMSATEAVTTTDATTDSAPVTDTVSISDTESLTDTVDLTDEEATPPEAETLDEAEALALALELRQRLLDGEDFATLAAEYSDDTVSGADGGDLGWFGRGAMVPVFEDAAFSLEVGEISEPIRSDFGYHIIEVLEKDDERPKEETALESERQQAYNTWIEEQIAATNVVRENLVSKLPRNLSAVIPQAAPAPATPLPPTQ